jgi:histidine triad (HIT) family protein
MQVGRRIGRAQMTAFSPARIGVIIAGMEVPHAHIHLVPIDREADLHFENADRNAQPEDLDSAADSLREALSR